MPSPSNNLRRARPMLGTMVEIKATGSDSILSEAMGAAFAAIEHVERTMSFHDDRSDVSRINQAEVDTIVAINPHTYLVLRFAAQLSEMSGGAFDISIAKVLVREGFLPKPLQGKAGSCFATYRDLELLPGNCVRWQQKGWIDLGGIAKGYAVDCAIAALASYGMISGLVNAGGDLRCFGEPQPIHLRRPEAPSTLESLGWLSDRAIATSSGYFAGITVGDRRIDPLVDPNRHACTTWGGSVSVIAPDCMTADALTKIVRLAPDRAPEILDRLQAQAIVLDPEGRRTCGPMLLQESAPI